MHNKMFDCRIARLISYKVIFPLVVFRKFKFCSCRNIFILNNINFSVALKFKFMSEFYVNLFAGISCSDFLSNLDGLPN